jgi:hypothetical protein
VTPLPPQLLLLVAMGLQRMWMPQVPPSECYRRPPHSSRGASLTSELLHPLQRQPCLQLLVLLLRARVGLSERYSIPRLS